MKIIFFSISKVISYSLTILNDSKENLFFTLFTYNQKKSVKMTRVFEDSKSISQGTSGVYRWPVNLKLSYDPNVMYYIAASYRVPIYGVDIQTATNAITIALDSRTESTRTKIIRYSEMFNLSDSR